ncbi:MAG: glutaredoxin 3 [Nitrososphaerales archaeon]
MPKIIVYTKEICPFCKYAKALLRSKGVDFEEIDIGIDEALQEKIWQLSGRKTVPQIFVDGRPVGGFEELRELDASGELEKILDIRREN